MAAKASPREHVPLRSDVSRQDDLEALTPRVALQEVALGDILERLPTEGTELYRAFKKGRKAVLDYIVSSTTKKYSGKSLTDIEDLVKRNEAEIIAAVIDAVPRWQRWFAPDEGKSMMADIVNRSFALGLMNFLTMPLVFFLAVHGKIILIYPLIALKFLAGAYEQRKVTIDFLQWFRTNSSRVLGGYVLEIESLEHLMHGSFFPSEMTAVKALLAVVAMGKFSIEMSSALSETIDPDFDAMTAGGSWHILKPPQEEKFAQAWENIPIAGLILPHLGLPGAMTLALFIAWVSQVRDLIGYRANCIDELMNDSFRKFLNSFSHMTDIGGTLVIHRCAFNAWQAHQSRKVQYPPDKGATFFNKVMMEVVPSAWLQISYLQVIFDDVSPLSRLNVLLSVLSSFNVAFSAVKLHVPYLIRCYHDGRFSGDLFVQKLGVAFCLTIFLFSIMMARLAGIILCDSHEYQVSHLQCLAVPA